MGRLPHYLREISIDTSRDNSVDDTFKANEEENLAEIEEAQFQNQRILKKSFKKCCLAFY